MGFFTPSWQSKNSERRAKALDKLPQQKLLEIIRSDESSEEAKLAKKEAVFRLDQDGLMTVALDNKIWDWLRELAVEQIRDESQLMDLVRAETLGERYDRQRDAVTRKILNRLSQEALADLALDPSADATLRLMAVSKVNDEKTVAAYIQDESARYRQDSLWKQMHTGSLIAACAVKMGLIHDGYKRLVELKDDETLRILALDTEKTGYTAENIAEHFTKDDAFLVRLAREAKSEDMRMSAQKELMKRGIAPPDLCADARKQVMALLNEPDSDGGRILSLLPIAAADPLTPEERDGLYRVFLRNPLSTTVPEFLKRCGDPAGPAFLPFIDNLYIHGGDVSVEELDRVLDVPEDFALDYLEAFLRKAEKKKGYGRLDGPSTLFGRCAAAIHLMHENGRAKERIERELKSVQSYDIFFIYSDPDNEIWNERETFSVCFWE